MAHKRQSGFTLIELLITLAVLSILLGVGVPSFIDVMKNSRMSSNYNALVGSLYLARSEAVKGAEFVTVCARASDSTCGADWTKGWLVYVDGTPDFTQTTPTIDSADTILDIIQDRTGNIAITGWGSSDGTASGASAKNFVRYQSNGATAWKNGYFKLCDTERGAIHSRAVNVVLTGDIRRGRQATGAAPKNVFNTEITC